MGTFFGPWDLGKLISDTFNIYKKNWMYYIAIVAPFAIIGAIITWGLSFAVSGTMILPGIAYPDNWSFLTLFAILGFGLLGGLIAVIINVLVHNAMMNMVGQQYFTNQLSIGKAFTAAIRKLVAVLLAGLLRIIILGLIFITIIGIPFAIYLAIKWILVTPVILFEGKGVSESLSRSSQLVKNNWWRVLVYMIIIGILVSIINWILGQIPVVGGTIGAIITMPITVISTTLIYFTLRVEKEQYHPAQLKVDLDNWYNDGAPSYPAQAPAVTEAPAATEAPAGTADATYCTGCGVKRSSDAAYCTKCGAPFTDTATTVYCSSCGKQTSSKATFCSNCGKPLDLGKPPKDDTPQNDGPFIK